LERLGQQVKQVLLALERLELRVLLALERLERQVLQVNKERQELLALLANKE